MTIKNQRQDTTIYKTTQKTKDQVTDHQKLQVVLSNLEVYIFVIISCSICVNRRVVHGKYKLCDNSQSVKSRSRERGWYNSQDNLNESVNLCDKYIS